MSEKFSVPDAGKFSGLYVLDGAGVMRTGAISMELEKASQFFLPQGAKALTFQAAPGMPLKMLRFFGVE